eukprot:gnl/Ergobibamus_cyprinoides/5971.p1 GENE.gnl/Ergobibamus_cyprinoides/5971~~gnl/Ergobibamus_cyprinoides/5971.p1  ORF type:complete len:148 (-),score=46.40 gnl/Ergobibamus_cyprinoides/5971:187-630(-)
MTQRGKKTLLSLTLSRPLLPLLLTRLSSPPLAKILGVAIKPACDAWAAFLSEWSKRTDKLVAEVQEHGSDALARELRSANYHFNWTYWGGMSAASNHLDTMDEPLRVLGDFVSHLSSWSLIYNGNRRMMELSRKAYFTVGLLASGYA